MPFYGEIRSQDGTVRNEKNHTMKPEMVMEMDWLNDNVIGCIPQMSKLIDAAQPVVQVKGVEDTK